MADEYALKTDSPPSTPAKGVSRGRSPEPVPVLRPGVRPRRGVIGHVWDAYLCLLPISLFAGACALVLAAQRPPEFYAAAVQSLPPPARRQELAREVEQKRDALQAAPPNQQEWSLELTEEQINSWLAERFGKTDWEELPQVSDPRVQIQPEVLRVGVKSAQHNSVLSFDIRPTVSGPRQVTLKIEAIRSGVIPLPVSQIELPPTGSFDGEGWELRWKHDPVQQTIVLDWDGRQTGILSDWKVVELQNKHVTIRGKRSETPPGTPAAPSVSATDKKPEPENSAPTKTDEKEVEPAPKKP